MKVAITGTREGMTPRQKKALIKILKYLPIEEFYHGGCKGVDVQARDILLKNRKEVKLICIPGDADQETSNKQYDQQVDSVTPYLQRNKIMVQAADMLIAIPSSLEEQQRSGTWHTIRFARSIKCPSIILDP